MPFDGIALNTTLQEIKHLLTDSRIFKIYQPKKDEIILNLWQGKSEFKLILSANPTKCRLHLTENQHKNPLSPPMFCMLLRKYLLGGKILDINQKGLERIIEITIQNKDEFMQPKDWKLIIEIMGKHSNIILVEPKNNVIIDSIKRISSDVNRYREILPGQKYILPPMEKNINLLTFNKAEFLSNLNLSMAQDGQKALSKWIIDNFMGLGGIASQEIAYRAKINHKKPICNLTPEEIENLIKVCQELSINIQKLNFLPTLYLNEIQEPVDFWSFPLLHKDQTYKKTQGKSINHIIDFYFSMKEEQEALNKLKKNLTSSISKNLKKLRQNLFFLNKQLNETKDMEKYKLWGELLSAYLYMVKPGQKEVILPNYYDNGKEITIPLNEKYSPSKNTQIYFKRYKKLNTKKIWSENKLKSTLAEINYLESTLVNIDYCTKVEDLNEILAELQNEGYIKKSPKKPSNKKHAAVHKSEPLKFKSTEGFTIYVGKNNRQNDILTFKKAKPDDIWLHTKDIPGSHVIIQCNGQEVNENTILEACSLAAYFSKGRNSSNVPVDYTFVKHVKKPNGAKPGFVIYDHQNTIFITPDKNIITKLSF